MSTEHEPPELTVEPARPPTARASGPVESAAGDPPSAWLTVLTTEHYNLQTQRASTIGETNGRATIFLGAVSAGLIALGFSVQPGPPTPGFVAFGVIVLGALVFLGVVTFVRVLQTSIDDAIFAARIEVIRDTYAALLPDLAPTLSRVRTREAYFPSAERGSFQKLVGVSGTVAVLTSILAGGTGGVLLYGLTTSLLIAIPLGVAVGSTVVTVMLGAQTRAWLRSKAM